MRETLTTARLTLRPLLLADAKAYAHYGSDFEVARMTGSFPHPFPQLSAEFKIMQLQSFVRRKLAYIYVLSQDDGTFMGDFTLFRNRAEPGEDASFTLGYWIGRPFWAQGFISEAAQAVVSEARTTFGTDLRLLASIYHDNLGSMAIVKKLGFTRKKVEGQESTRRGFSMARMGSDTLYDFVWSAESALVKAPTSA